MTNEATTPAAAGAQTFQVEGMTCAHCAGAIEREVRRVDGVTDVRVDVGAGDVTVTSSDGVPEAAIAAAVDEAGYTLVGSR